MRAPTSSRPTAAFPTRNTAIFGGTLNAAGLSAAGEFSFIAEPGVTPPDSTGAIGPFQYIEIVNSEIAMWNRTDLSPLGSPVPLDTFDGGIQSCDPQIKYDPQSGRWFYLALRCDLTPTSNQLYLGWSKTSNPSDLTSSSWCTFTIPTTPATSLDDYPKLGIDAGHIIIGANLFDISSLAFQTAQILTGPKPPAGSITSCGSAPTFTVFGSPAASLSTPAGNPAFTPEPATVADGSSQAGYVIAADQDATGGGSNLMLWHVGGSAASPTLVADGDISISSFAAPLQGVAQPGSTDPLDPLDGRLTQAVMANDPNAGASGAEAIWTQHTIDDGSGGTQVRWYEVVPSTKTVRQSGTITDTAGFAFNGAIAPTLNGGAVINYNTGGSSQDVKVKAQARNGTDGLGTMTALGSPLATSTAVDSDLSCPSNSGGPVCRWGDYAGASADPACPDVAWGSSQITIPANNPADAQWQAQNFAVTPSSAALLACFTATPNPVAAGTAVSFDASDSKDSGGTPSSWTWDFGDGRSASTQKPTHTFTSAGTYKVKLTVGDGTNTATATQLVTVEGPPSASFTAAPNPAPAGSPVGFDASGSTDPATTITTYAWNFGDGNTGSGVAPTHTYAAAGTYIATLTVADGFGKHSTTSHTINVVGPPSASFTAGPNPAIAGAQMSFNAATSTDPGTTITTYTWNFGDGNTGSGVAPTHKYAAAGTYAATLTIADGFGKTSTTSQGITVVGPLATSFTATPNPATAGSPVHFDGGGSSDPGSAITSYAWNFGDGGTGSGATPTHTFEKPGSYTVTMTAADGVGQTATSTQVLTINKPRLSGKLTSRKTQGRAAVLKHGLVVSVTVSENVSARFQIVRQIGSRNPHGKPTSVTLLRSPSRRLTAGASKARLELSTPAARQLPGTGPVRLTVRVVLTDAYGQSLTLSGKVTLT